MKIVHVVHSLELGGLENGLVNLVNRLDPVRFHHTIVCLTRAGSFASRIKNHEVAVVEVGASGESFRFPLLKLARLFREIGPDVVHTRGWGAVDAVFAARLAQIGSIIHGEHGREWTDTRGSNWKRNQFRRGVGRLVKWYVFVSDFFRPWLTGQCGVRAGKIIYIPNGVDTERFSPFEDAVFARPSCSSRRAMREQLGLPAEGPLIGSVGRLDPVKDLPTLLKSFASVLSELPAARLAVVGDGPMKGELESTARALRIDHAVAWLGRRDDIPALLRYFDIFVQSSLFEGMSNTILEAMASGLPIIASRTGGNGDLVAEGENGFLFEVGDAPALTQAIRRYLLDLSLRNAHALESRRRALKHFDISLMAERYADLYSKSC